MKYDARQPKCQNRWSSFVEGIGMIAGCASYVMSGAELMAPKAVTRKSDLALQSHNRGLVDNNYCSVCICRL